MAQALKVISPVVGGFGQDRAARYEAKQLEAQGKAVEAQGTRQAENIRRNVQGILGDLTAATVAQGGSNSDPGAIRRAAKIESRGKFNEEAALFGAGEQAAGLRNKGRAARFQGRMARNQGIMQGVGNFLSSGKDAASAGSSMLKVFGG